MIAAVAIARHIHRPTRVLYQPEDFAGAFREPQSIPPGRLASRRCLVPSLEGCPLRLKLAAAAKLRSAHRSTGKTQRGQHDDQIPAQTGTIKKAGHMMTPPMSTVSVTGTSSIASLNQRTRLIAAGAGVEPRR